MADTFGGLLGLIALARLAFAFGSGERVQTLREGLKPWESQECDEPLFSMMRLMFGLLFSRDGVGSCDRCRQTARFCHQEEILAPIYDGEMFGGTPLRGYTMRDVDNDSCWTRLQLSSLIANCGDGWVTASWSLVVVIGGILVCPENFQLSVMNSLQSILKA